MQSGVQFNDQFSDLSARLNAILCEENADGASIDIVLTTFNEPLSSMPFRVRDKLVASMPARSKLGARRAFSFNA